MAAKKKTNKKVVRKKHVKRPRIRVAPVKRVRTQKVKNKFISDYRPSRTVAIIALLVNLLLFPGLGTIMGGRTREGIWQIVLFGLGVILSIVLIGIPIIIVAWVWALISGIRILERDAK